MTNTPTSEDVAKIAALLSEAQRRALSDTLGAADMQVVRFEHFRSTKALHAKGLIGLCMTPGVLTPLGLAVRSHLTREQRDG